MTMLSQDKFSKKKSETDIIVDGGASLSVIGWKVYIDVCYQLGVEPKVLTKLGSDPDFHAFGTPGNSSSKERVVGRCTIPVPVGRGEVMKIGAIVVDGHVLFIMGKDMLMEYKCVEDHSNQRSEFALHSRKVRLPTYLKDGDGHSRVRLNAISERVNIAESLLTNFGTRTNGEELVKRIHSRTHIHPTTVEMLLKRCGRWDTSARNELKKIESSCMVCKKAGEPAVMKKFSLSKLCREFNDCIEMDVMYWGKNIALHVVDTATSYSECSTMTSRSARSIKRALECTWFLRHGSPK